MKRASIADVAQLAGVSTATVSRVTTSPDKVAKTTREKVLRAIEELHFVKSATGLSLKAQQSKNILVVVSSIGNIYWSEIVAGIHQRAEQSGYNVMITTSSNQAWKANRAPSDNRQRGVDILDRLHTGKVDGVIILDGSDVSDKQYAMLSEVYQGTPPLVGFAEGRNLLKYPHVFLDNRCAAVRATNYLIEQGHTHIAHVRGVWGNPVADQRYEGFISAMLAAGLKVASEDVLDAEFHRDAGRRAARRIARRADRPTAIFCATDELAMGCIAEFSTLGINVPEDISMMGFDNNSFADVYVPPLTTMAQPREQIGVSTLDLLLKVMADPSTKTNYSVELDVYLAKRASVAPNRKNASPN